MGHDLESILAQSAADIASRAVEEGISRGQHDDSATSRSLDPLDKFLEACCVFQAATKRLWQKTRTGIRPDEQFGLFEQSASLAGHPVEAVIANADDLNLDLNTLAMAVVSGRRHTFSRRNRPSSRSPVGLTGTMWSGLK